MIRISQLRADVIRPACRLVGWHAPAAEDLLVGTFLAESLVDGDTCLRQLGGGPALGIFQMEPATHDDIWRHWLGYRPEGERVRALTPAGHGFPRAENLVFNLLYAAPMARAHYRRVPSALPTHGDVDGYAAYWKRHYNTRLGKGDPAEFAQRFRQFAT